MSETGRDENGRFTGDVTKQDILLAFDRQEAPFLTATELGEELGISRQAANYRLKQMQDEGIVGRKETGARAVAWWAKRAPRLSPEARKRADAADRDDAVPLDDLEVEFAGDA